jgi:hypothetical protein
VNRPGRSAFQGDDERVFCSPLTGGPIDPARYTATFRAALKRAKIDRPMRPFHAGRHTSITNAAAAAVSPAALMARAGHSDFKTTQGYIDLAGGRSGRKPSWPTSVCSAPLGKSPGKTRPSRCPSCRRLALSTRRKAPCERGFFLGGAAQESNLPSDGLRRLTGFEDEEPKSRFPGQRH